MSPLHRCCITKFSFNIPKDLKITEMVTNIIIRTLKSAEKESGHSEFRVLGREVSDMQTDVDNSKGRYKVLSDHKHPSEITSVYIRDHETCNSTKTSET